MSRLMSRLKAAERSLWLDDELYAARLFADGVPPYLSTPDYVAFRSQAAGLLHSDILSLSLRALCSAWLDAHPDLVTRMGAKTRVGAPLRAMFADETLREFLTATVNALSVALREVPLVLVCPTPESWLVAAHERCAAPLDSVESDAVEKAAVYLAEFLRAFAECAVDGLLLTADNSRPAAAPDSSAYRPVLNVAEHYRWPAGFDACRVPFTAEMAVDSSAFAVSRVVLEGLVTVTALDEEIWRGAPLGELPPGCLFSIISPESQPEQVLATLQALRQH